jgi:hypothetical protein
LTNLKRIMDFANDYVHNACAKNAPSDFYDWSDRQNDCILCLIMIYYGIFILSLFAHTVQSVYALKKMIHNV